MATRILVYEKKTNEVVHTIDCGDKDARSIGRIRDGMHINMNRDEYATRVVTDEVKAGS